MLQGLASVSVDVLPLLAPQTSLFIPPIFIILKELLLLTCIKYSLAPVITTALFQGVVKELATGISVAVIVKVLEVEPYEFALITVTV